MRLFCFSLILVIISSCNNSRVTRSELIDFIPENSEIVLKTANLESLLSTLENNDFVALFSKTESYASLKTKLENLRHLNTNDQVIICFSQEDKDIGYTVITKYIPDLFLSDSLKNYSEETITYKNKSIIQSKLNENTFYSTVVDSIFFLSSSKTNVDLLHRSKNPSSELIPFDAVTDSETGTSLLINSKSPLLDHFFIEDNLSNAGLADIFAIDVQFGEDDIFVNGIAKSKDSTPNIIDIFEHTIPQESKTSTIAPSNGDGFTSFTFDNFERFNHNLLQYKQKDTVLEHNTLFDEIVEVGTIYEGSENAIVLNSIDVIATQDALLSEQNILATYRDIDIFSFSQPAIFKNTFLPFIVYDKASKYCIIESFFVFSDSIELLQNIIANFQNKTTFSEKVYYQRMTKNFSDECSLMTVLKPNLLQGVLAKNLNGKDKLETGSYNISGLQFVYDHNFAHVHGSINKKKKNIAQNSISEEFSLDLDNELLNSPQFVSNHLTKEKDIVVQDVNNTLYLISNKGKIQWKKRLNGAILGPISQIDIYKNGRLQLVFATPNRVYVVDRKGRDVGPFPLKFNDNITQPLSVFDYDNNKKYRLMVTQGRYVLMYDVKGKIVKGFTFKSANQSIISQPKHFRIGSKDYLVLKTKSKLYILDRNGKTRVSPKSDYTYSKEPVFLYQGKFTTTGENGSLVSVDTRGNTNAANINLAPNHAIETTSKTRVTLNENKLGIKAKVLELDYGNYTRPQIFYITNKIYVAITDLQAKKVHLFDSQAKKRPNFPVYGTSAIDLDNCDSDRNLEFVVQGESNSILLYQIN